MPPSMRATEHQLSTSHQQHQTNNSVLPDSQRSIVQRDTLGLESPIVANFSSAFIDASSASVNLSSTVSDPDSRHPPVSLHRRSTSINDIRNGVGNLNRWSQSTSSSRPSSAHHQRSNSFSRHMNFSGSGPNTAGTPSTAQSPARSQKSPTYTFESPQRGTSASNRKRSSGALPGLLPPIITIPLVQESANQNSSQDSTFIQTPSTAAVISAIAHQTNPDYFSKALDSQNKGGLSPGTSDINIRRPSAASAHTGPTATSPEEQSRSRNKSKDRGHSRNRSQSGKSSGGTDSSPKSKEKGPKLSQKAMLSKALQKANTAVLLDNAQNFEGAVQAYSEACALLQQVMVRSSGNDDKRKLEAIRNTYTSRISELNKITPQVQQDDEKALPARPRSKELRDEELHVTLSEEEGDEAVISTATVTRIVNDHSYYADPQQSQNTQPQRRQSRLQSNLDPVQYSRRHTDQQNASNRSFSKSPMRGEGITERRSSLAPPIENDYMPPPLSPRRPSSPTEYEPGVQQSGGYINAAAPAPAGKGHLRNPSSESMSWLDTIDESGASTTSSVHSRTSSFGMRRKHIRAPSGATEAEFDAALDAAVEAAYDDGFEPFGESQPAQPATYDDDMMSSVRRKVELAKERVRQTERESAIQYAHEREKARRLQESRQQEHEDDIYEDNESDEEERMLDEMTRGYHMDDFEFGLQSKSALPRESDSSGFSGRTWNSSIGSNPTTAGTTLSPVTEASSMPQLPSLASRATPPLMHPPPIHALPPPPAPGGAGISTAQPYPPPSAPLPIPMSSSLPIQSSIPGSPAKSVRNRRLSGQNAAQLKIETVDVQSSDENGPPTKAPPKVPQLSASAIPKTAGLMSQQRGAVSGNKAPPIMFTRQTSSPFPGPTQQDDITPPSLALTQTMSDESEGGPPRSGSPSRSQSRGGLRKNFSSTSLKTMKGRNLSITGLEDLADGSPNTPGGNTFPMPSRESRIPAMPALPTPIATAFKDKLNGIPTGGFFLFDSDIHSPESPGSPNPLNNNSPIPLEPCPAEHLLRPFWLMRAVYQTIAHPRGGYLSTKLFVPRDVWRVKGVKLKGLEDKISNCDFLTAALLKLGKVDTNDADAVLEEMQALETVLEQVQAALTKKLGNEVGPHGTAGFFKDTTTELGSDAAPKSAVAPKSSSFSWKRLRSKNSAMGLTNNYATKTSMDGAKDSHTMSTLPMTSMTTIRFAKRDVNSIQFTGPNANYMGSLARLFDAAQVIDQIARQVEDPGLRHADKTQVGLELSTRHAAEFFGFYICKFVLTDISMLLDKFIKRGTEWVMV